MNSIATWWMGLGLRVRMQILIQGLLILVLGAAQLWIANHFRDAVLDSAKIRARAVADGAINGLNTLMVTKAGNDDVISDKAARALFIQKMGGGDRIREMRIVRGKAIDAEFPAGLPQEQAVDALDQSVLASGREEMRLVEERDGSATIRAVLPFIARRNFRGTDCLQCHGVDEGAVLGAASVTIDVTDDLAAIGRTNERIWIAQGLLQLICGSALFLIARGVVRQLGGEPAAAANLARLVAQGDLSVRLEVHRGDKTSLMALLREMQVSLAQRSAQAAREITVLISGSVDRVAHGTALVDQASATMQDIVASIERVTHIMHEISTASAQQSSGVAEVGQAIVQMDRTTQQNAALVEQSAAAAQSLKEQAQQLVQTVALFKLAAG